MSARTVTLPPLHPSQRQIVACPSRFVVASCGRRFGKGVASAVVELQTGLAGGQVWHLSPDYPSSQEHWRLLRYLGRQLGSLADIRQADMMISLRRGGFIQIKSANSLNRGSGLDHVTIDEAAHIPDLQDMWTMAIRPALSDRRGRALFTSTPNGLDYFHDLYGYGVDPAQHEWTSFTFPTSANPHIPADEIEAARLSLPDRVFRQEYLADFIEDGSGVFRFVRDAAILAPSEPHAGQRVVFGLDWGRSNDFTVCSGIDIDTRKQLFMDRFTDIGWELQRGRIKALYERWKPTAIWAEENSIGGPNIEALQAEGLPVYPFATTNASKADMINDLSLAIEKSYAHQDGGITLLDDGVQTAELQAYGFERLPSGVYRYGAPSGKHDDTVIALALAWHGVRQYRSSAAIYVGSNRVF